MARYDVDTYNVCTWDVEQSLSSVHWQAVPLHKPQRLPGGSGMGRSKDA
jgi:hypothetical protein